MAVNAKAEFLSFVLGTGCSVSAAVVINCPSGGVFLNNLDFEYDNGYSAQYLFGTIMG
jgi:hypothetical protein